MAKKIILSFAALSFIILNGHRVKFGPCVLANGGQIVSYCLNGKIVSNHEAFKIMYPDGWPGNPNIK